MTNSEVQKSIGRRREQVLIDKWIAQVELDGGLSKENEAQFQQWIKGLGDLVVTNTEHLAIGNMDEFPWYAVKLADLVESALDAGLDNGILNEEWAVESFKEQFEGLNEAGDVQYLAHLRGTSGETAWILVYAEECGQGGYQDRDFKLFHTRLQIEQYLRAQGFVFGPEAQTPSGQVDGFTDEEILKLLRESL